MSLGSLLVALSRDRGTFGLARRRIVQGRAARFGPARAVRPRSSESGRADHNGVEVLGW